MMIRVVLMRKDGVAEICPLDEMLAKSPILQKAVAIPFGLLDSLTDERVRAMPFDVQRFLRRHSNRRVVYYDEIGPERPPAA